MKRIFALVALSIFTFQLLGMSAVFAAPGSADLSIEWLNKKFAGTVREIQVCNDGDETVTDINFDVEATNFEIQLPFVAVGSSNNTATDDGFINSGLQWQGTLANGECIHLMFSGEETAAVGEETTFEIWIDSSTLSGAIANFDPVSGNDSASTGPLVIEEQADLAVTSRLLTQGEIVASTLVSYEVIISNVGTGTLGDGGMNVAFVVPSSASFEEVIDDDTGDALDLTGCFPYGPPSSVGPGLAGLDGTIVLCLLSRNAPLLPSTSYSFTFTMTATEEFVTGEVSTFVSVAGEDADSAIIQLDIANGISPAEGGYNNIMLLPYNNDELTVTINRCPGQNLVTTTGTGCFRISFNKLIWEPSFNEDDLILSGGGTAGTLQKVDDYTWDVLVTGIPLGATVSLTLEENGVQDFSAIANGVEVLGENVIRYEVETAGTNGSTAATGTLPATGSDNVAPWALLMVLIGIALHVSAVRPRKFLLSSRIF